MLARPGDLVQAIPIGDPMIRNTLAVAFACTLLSAGQLRAADAVDHAQLKKAHKEMEAQHREMEGAHKKMETDHARWLKEDKKSRGRKPDDAHVKLEKEHAQVVAKHRALVAKHRKLVKQHAALEKRHQKRKGPSDKGADDHARMETEQGRAFHGRWNADRGVGVAQELPPQRGEARRPAAAGRQG